MTVTVHHGDCREVLRGLPPESVQCCVTSPPYYGLRDYRCDGQIGLEQTPDAYVAQLVDVFRGVRRVLRSDGTVWLNLGDSYASLGERSNRSGLGKSGLKRNVRNEESRQRCLVDNKASSGRVGKIGIGDAKPKDLLGIPWRVAFALQADGWYLRSAIVWHKPNPMPESCKDRPTSAYEMVFLLAKRPTYFYDADAIREDWTYVRKGASGAKSLPYSAGSGRHDTLAAGGKRGLGVAPSKDGRNARNVWTISPKPFSGAHFATMPPDLVERCIKAGSRPGDTIIDPFGGAGTTGLVANRLGRSAVLIELNREFCDMAIRRINDASPLFANVA